MNEDVLGFFIAMVLFVVSVFGIKGCYLSEMERQDKKDDRYVQQGYIEKEFCTQYRKKWVKP